MRRPPAGSPAALGALRGAGPSRNARALVIGDVHGCLDELTGLLRLVADPAREVVFVGDLVAKGPDSQGVLALARELGARAVLGNHDRHALRWRETPCAGGPAPRRGPAWLPLGPALTEADWSYLGALPYFIRIPASRALVVHAGLVPGVAPKDQEPRWMLTMRSIRPDGSPSKRLADGVPWARLWSGPDLVLFGHDAISGLQEHPSAIGLDTGCVYGGRLTGLLLPERELVSVPARRRYATIDG